MNATTAQTNSMLASMEPVVCICARKMARAGVDWEDLAQEGRLGALRAIELFDPSAGASFKTYATRWIRAYIRRYMQYNRSLVRTGASLRTVDLDSSLDARVCAAEETSFMDILEDEDGVTPEDAVADMEERALVREAMERAASRLGPIGRAIIERRLCAATVGEERCSSEVPLAVISAEYGVSRQRVHQIEAKVRVVLAEELEESVRVA